MTIVNPLDAAWLHVESASTPMHVASLQIFTPPDGAPEDYVGRVVNEFKATRALARPWNKKLSGSLLDVVLPTWVTDDRLDLDYHVRHSGLPRPGGERELGVLVSRLHSYQLDLTRPLWECHFIEGLEGGRFAVYTKMHHSMIDGVSGMRLLQRMLSSDPDRREMPAPWAGVEDEDVLAESRTGGDSLAGALATVSEAVREQAGSLGNVGGALLQLVRSAWEPDDPLTAPLSCPWSVINGRVTAQRRLATLSLDLGEVKSLARTLDCTLNDLVLAVCSAAVRRYLTETGSLPDEPLTAGLPVNVRPAGDDETGTAITFMCANLATDLADPRERLGAIKASTARAKQHLQTLPRAALTQYTMTIMAPYILQLLTGLGGRLRPVFNITISNVPGPDHHLYLNGARLEAMYPMSLLTHGQALNITCLSYAGKLHFGFTGCRDTLPRVQRLAVYAGEAMDEVRALAQPAPASKRAPAKRRAPARRRPVATAPEPKVRRRTAAAPRTRARRRPSTPAPAEPAQDHERAEPSTSSTSPRSSGTL
jgi:WS/DGAT/MGAT family acyltransferase